MSRSTEKDYYQILHVSPSATQEEIKKAWRRELKFVHPDKWHNDPDMREEGERRSKDVNLAYEVLGNPERRAEYDLQRQASGQHSEHVHTDPLAMMYQQAIHCLNLGKWQEALDLLGEILNHNPHYRDTADLFRAAYQQLQRESYLADLYDRALRSLQQRQWQDAVDGFEKILGIDVEYRDTRSRLQQARQGLAREKEQEKLANHYAWSLKLIKERSWGPAIGLLEEILKIDPSYRDVKHLLEKTKKQREKELHQREQAIREAREELHKGNLAHARAILEQLLKALPDSEEAVALLDKVCEEEDLAALYQKGVEAYRAKRWKLASEGLGQVLQRKPDFRDAVNFLKLAQRKQIVRRRMAIGLLSGTTAVLLIAYFVWGLTAPAAGSQTGSKHSTDVTEITGSPTEVGRMSTSLPAPSPFPSHLPSPTGTTTAEPTAGAIATDVPALGSPGADQIVAYNPGIGAERRFRDPDALLGQPDLVENPCCDGMLQLGQGGSVVLMFTDNLIENRNGADFIVYGESAKDDYLLIEISADGEAWHAYPRASESPGMLDLADVGLETALYVRLTDLQPGTSTGAEVDAVVALHSGPGLGRPPSGLPDAVAREDIAVYEGPGDETQPTGKVEAGSLVIVIGRTESNEWARVRTESGAVGWLPVQQLGLNISLSEVPANPTTPTASPMPQPSATHAPSSPPTPAPAKPKWVLVADSRRDYPDRQHSQRWWYLWSSGRYNFNWQEMQWDDPNWCYKSSNDWDLRICQDRIQTDSRGDVALQWKAPQGGTYRFEWDSGTLLFYKHLSQVGSQGPGADFPYSATISDVIDWELFFWVTRNPTGYHVRVYRLQE